MFWGTWKKLVLATAIDSCLGMSDTDSSDEGLEEYVERRDKEEKIRGAMESPNVQDILKIDPSVGFSVGGRQPPPGRTASLKREHVSNQMIALREQCDSQEKVLYQAQILKESANQCFAKGDNPNALQAYLSAIWLIKEGEVPLTRSLTFEAGQAPYGEDVVSTLGAGVRVAAEPPQPPEFAALREVLHLNTAATCLQVSS